jgi:hypothetical protein
MPTSSFDNLWPSVFSVLSSLRNLKLGPAFGGNSSSNSAASSILCKGSDARWPIKNQHKKWKYEMFVLMRVRETRSMQCKQVLKENPYLRKNDQD